MIRWIGWVAVIMALTGLFFGGCDWKKKEQVLACQCMVDCMDQIDRDTPQGKMKCQKMCKGKHFEGWDQGSQMAIQVLDGDRDDCSL